MLDTPGLAGAGIGGGRQASGSAFGRNAAGDSGANREIILKRCPTNDLKSHSALSLYHGVLNGLARPAGGAGSGGRASRAASGDEGANREIIGDGEANP